MVSKKERPIIVAGIKLDKKNFPQLYRIAERNPEGLAEQLKNNAEELKVSVVGAAQALENDLEHDLAL